MVKYTEELEDRVAELEELCDILDEDLGDMEELLLDDDDDDDECGCNFEDLYDDDEDEQYETVCPTCGKCILLDERTRELCGETLRWEDLARTRTLDARWHAFNDGVSRGIGDFKADKHYYRPIPQSFLDGITTESGAGLTAEQKQAMQNPGY